MQINSFKTLLGVAAISAFVIGCGKGFEPPKFDGSNGTGPSQVKPSTIDNPDMKLMADTLKGAQLIKTDKGVLEILGLVYINDQNVFEILAEFKDMQDGPENRQEVLADKISVASVMDTNTQVDAQPANKITATCYENCKVVSIIMNLNTFEGKSFDVSMHFKQVELEGSYFLDQSDAGQKRGYDALAYAKTLVELQAQVTKETLSSAIDPDTQAGKDGGNISNDNDKEDTETPGTGSAELDALGGMIGDGITNISNTVLSAYTGGQVGADTSTQTQTTDVVTPETETPVAETETPAEVTSWGEWFSNGWNTIVSNWEAVKEHAEAQEAAELAANEDEKSSEQRDANEIFGPDSLKAL